jgi:amino acid transporter
MATKEQLIQEDIKRLHGMGYAQELYRAMGGFSNFAISFTIISVLSGCLTLFYLGMGSAGPAAASLGWPLVSLFTLLVALSMAELASAFPTAGGLYYWSSKLGGPGWGWFTGWFNLIGQVAITAGIDYGLATFVNILMNQWWGTPQTAGVILVTYAVCLTLHAIMNILGVRVVALLNDVSVWWHIVTVALIVAFLAFKAPAHSFSTAFHTGFTTGGFPYWYGFLIGLFLAQYTFTGYDASAHMTEETIGAELRAPWGVVMSVVVSAIAGYALLMALVVTIPSVPGKTDVDKISTVAGTLASPNGNPVGTILNSGLGQNLGTFLLALAVVAQFYCGMSSITSNSRMFYAFSRDGAMPLSNVWHTLNRRFRTPANAIVLGAVLAFLLAVPSYWNTTAYAAVTSIATIGLYIAYIIPVFLRWRMGAAFTRGKWHLGGWSPIINIVAILWVIFISILFMLPILKPITRDNFNYAPVALVLTVGALTIWYVVSVRHWFTGPKVMGTAEQMAQIEHELGEDLGIAPA